MKFGELSLILDTSKGERELLNFIKENPFVLTQSLSYLGNPTRVIAEFPLGTEYKADFVVVAPFSGAIEVRLIEIEPPSAPIFNANGTLAQRGNKALEQVNSWKTYISKNRRQYLRDLDWHVTDKDLFGKHSERLTCTAGWEIFHPRICIYESYTMIIGRRSFLDEKHLEKKAEFKKNNEVEIATCDRLLNGAKFIDDNSHIL